MGNQRLNTAVEALRNRHFRWLWIGRLTSSASFEIGMIARGWLVYELTGSALTLGWVSSGWSISTLVFSLYGGVISDRLEKRNIILWARTAMALNTLVIAVLISVGAIRIWHLMASSLLAGAFFSLMMPAEQAIVVELVGRGTLLNAMALNSIGMGLTGILAASAAGFLIEFVGVGGVYYLTLVLYLVTIFAMTNLPRMGTHARTASSAWSTLREGIRYTAHHRVLLLLLGLALTRVLFAMPYRTFMPKFAKEVMGLDAGGLGLLMAASGTGSLISSLTVASLGDFRGKGRLLLIAGVIAGVSLVLFANTHHLLPVLLLLALMGAAGNICMMTNNTLLQVNATDQFRGRVMSVYMMMWGLTPLGTLPAGAIADRMGVPFIVALQGGALALIFLGMLLWTKVRTLE